MSSAGNKETTPDAAQVDTSIPHYGPPGRVDFTAAGLPEYEGCFAIILDDLFSPSELTRFLATAEASSTWNVAAINATSDISYVNTSYRNGQRIILDDHALSKEIFDRVRPHLKDIEKIEDVEWKRTKKGREKVVVKKRMVRMNERLRFLRYPKGGFFGQHCDGPYMTPDGTQMTYYTLQLYLPSSTDGSEAARVPAKGGATRFRSHQTSAYCDVEPIPGRVLVFQHEKLLHTGEEVLDGIKCTVRSDILYRTSSSGAFGSWGLSAPGFDTFGQ